MTRVAVAAHNDRLSGVLVSRFEIPQRNVATFEKVDFGTTYVNQTSCLNGAKPVTIQQLGFCVLADADFDRIYPDSKSPGPASAPAAKDSSYSAAAAVAHSAAARVQEAMASVLVLVAAAAVAGVM